MTIFKSRVFFSFIFLSCCSLFFKAQDKSIREIDSLETPIKNAKTTQDKNVLKVRQLNLALRVKDTLYYPQLAKKYITEAKRDENYELLVGAIQSTGIYFYNQNDYSRALKYLDTSCTLAKKHKLEKALMASLMTRGAIYFIVENPYNALINYLESEKLMLKYKSSKIGGLYTNISLIYSNIGDIELSESYLKKAIPLLKLSKDNEGLAKAYNSLGLNYKKRENYPAADSAFRMGLEIARKEGFERDVSDILYNLSGVLAALNKKEEALAYRLELYELVKKTEEPNWEKMITLDVAVSYLGVNDKANMQKFLKKAEAIEWDELAAPSQMTDYYTELAKFYFYFKDYKTSAEAYEKVFKIKAESNMDNGLFDVEKIKYRYEKQQDSLSYTKQKEIDDLYNEKIHQESQHKLSQQRIFTFISIIVLLVIAVFSGFLFRANRQKELANNELKEQKQIVSEKNKEITDSINYSQRIQKSLLPTKQALTRFLPNHFLIYLPKDIVSGDFYWLKEINQDEFFIAVADCTGHGVPGAIMSALSIQLLNEISETVTEPHKILNELNKKLKANLNQDEEGFSKDGLDICLCKINKQTNKMDYCGANRNLWIFDERGLKQETKATKAGIGGHTKLDQVYVTNEISINSNDLFLLSTDGYADQFGGDKMKKITTKQFKLWVAQTDGMSFKEKEIFLLNSFFNWKNNSSQIDDVCVLGFKFV